MDSNVKQIEASDYQLRFRIEREPTDPNWKSRAGRKPWCEITTSHDGHVRSYGGEVWPMAWPDWFAAIPNTVQGGSGRVELTPEGARALGFES